MRSLLASLLILGSLLSAGAAHANRWDQQRQQPYNGERRPLFQRRQQEPMPQAEPNREAPANAPQPQQTAPAATGPRASLQPAEAGRRAQQQYGGRVLSVAPTDSGYHVRLLRNGEVSVVTVPNQ